MSASASLAPSIFHFHTNDPDELANALPGWQQEIYQLSRGAFMGKGLFVALPGFQIFKQSTNQVLQSPCQGPPGMLAFGVHFGSGGGYRWCGQEISPQQEAILTLNPKKEGMLLTSQSQELAVATLDLREVLSYGEDLYSQDFGKILEKNRAFGGNSSFPVRLRRYLRDFLETAERQTEIITWGPNLIATLKQRLMSLLLAAINQNRQEIQPRPSLAWRRLVVKRSMDCPWDQLESPLTLRDLCRATGASVRTLNYAFRDLVGLSPMAYLKIRRLHGVRRDLKTARWGEQSVFDIASCWGFWHMGHFSQDYKWFFGESPSETLRRWNN